MKLEQVFQKLLHIESMQQQILARLDNPAAQGVAAPDFSEWLPAEKVRDILGISYSTLYRLRKNNKLRSSRMGSRDYYYAPDIFASVKSFLK